VKLEELFKAIEDMRDKASVRAVFGEPVEVGGKTIIPVADVKYGFGVGYGEGSPAKEEEAEPPASGSGGGAGGGIAARPVAVLEITDDGVKVKPIVDEGRIALAGICMGAWSVFWLAATLRAIFGKR